MEQKNDHKQDDDHNQYHHLKSSSLSHILNDHSQYDRHHYDYNNDQSRQSTNVVAAI